MRQIHPLKPIYDKNSKILILGSFPSEISRKNNFYYANPNNRFWHILEILFKTKLNSKDDKINLLLNNHIALWDVIASCEIYKSSDSSIKNIIPNDINKILNNSNIKYIFVNGKKALELYNKYLLNTSNINAIYLPSTSCAIATYTLDKLVNEYKIIKKKMLDNC